MSSMNMMPDLRWQTAYRVVVLDKRHCTVRIKDNTITRRRLFEEVEERSMSKLWCLAIVLDTEI